MKQLIPTIIVLCSFFIHSLAISQSDKSAMTAKMVPILYLLLEDDASTEVEPIAPVVSFLKPSANQSFIQGDAIAVEALASDVDGSIHHVELYLDNTIVRWEGLAPYTWNDTENGGLSDDVLNELSIGEHLLRVVAVDDQGLRSSKSISINVLASDSNTAPSVSFTIPTVNQVIAEGQSLAVTVTASDSDGSVSKVDLYLDNQLVSADAVAPYSWNLANLSVSSHTLRAVAVDNEGAQSQISIAFSVVADPVNQAPSVSFTQPSNNQSFVQGNTVSVIASANDTDGTVNRVELYVDGVLNSADSSVPYSWNVSGLSLGGHTLKLVAVDDDGTPAEASINMTVIEQPPVADIASRTLGVAPLSVYFDSGYEGDDFHDYHFTWDFGGEASEINAWNGLSKNTDIGPISGHLYEQAGTYTVTLTVRDASGVVETKSTTITVTDTDAAYPTTQTKCISKSGNFAGCPSGAQQLTYSDSQVDSNIYTLLGVENTRVLFHRGEQWNLEGIGNGVVNDVYIGAYGVCLSPDVRGICSNAPILNNTGVTFPSLLSFRVGSRNITIEDIHMTAPNLDSTHNITLFTSDNVLMNRVKNTVEGSLSGQGMHNSGIYNSDFSGGIVTIYTDGKNMIMKNNAFYDSEGSHVVRIPIGRKLVFTHNEVHSSTIGDPAGTGPGLLIKLHSLHEDDLCNFPNGGARTDWCTRFVTGFGGVIEERFSTEYVYMANNIFGKGSNWGVALLAQNGTYSEKLSRVLFEKNRYDWTYGNPDAKGAMTHALTIQATDSVVRNNVFDTEGIPTYARVINVLNWNPYFPSNGLEIYNNTINASIMNVTQTPFIGIDVGSGQLNTTISNNLIVRPPNDPNGVAVRDAGVNTVQSNNLYIDDAQFIDDSGAPRNKNYRLKGNSPALNTGVTIPRVLDDLDGILRGGNQYDVGAYEQ